MVCDSAISPRLNKHGSSIKGSNPIWTQWQFLLLIFKTLFYLYSQKPPATKLNAYYMMCFPCLTWQKASKCLLDLKNLTVWDKRDNSMVRPFVTFLFKHGPTNLTRRTLLFLHCLPTFWSMSFPDMELFGCPHDSVLTNWDVNIICWLYFFFWSILSGLYYFF